MATKKKSAKKEAQTNVSKIKATAQSVGSQVKATATDIFEDMKKNTGEFRDAASKMEMTNSFKKIQTTVKNVNKEVMTTASDILEDVLENGKQFSDVAVKTVKETIEKVDLKEGVAQVRATAKTVNDYSLKTADEMLDAALENTEKWQNVAGKAVKGGLQLAERQQDMVFATLEEVKGQLVNSAKRFRGLFSQN